MMYGIVAILILNCGTTLASASPTEFFNLGWQQVPDIGAAPCLGMKFWRREKYVINYLLYVISDIWYFYDLHINYVIFWFRMPRNTTRGYQHSEENSASVFRVKSYIIISTCLSLCMIATYTTKKTQFFSNDLLQIIWFTLDQIFYSKDTVKQF
jgi:hypothetical protein